MAYSRQPTHQLSHPGNLPARTPGPLGINDPADPNIRSRLGDTPGPLGINDHADPTLESSLYYILKITKCGPYASYMIPWPKSITPPLITDNDIQTAANTFGIDPAAIYAVSEVESGGRSGFDAKGRPKVLFEALWFHKFTAGIYDRTHPHLSQPTWQGAKHFYGMGQWKRLTEAFALDAEPALKSASWGKFQVMGFNHSGFKNVYDFCDGMFRSEGEHLKNFLAYCKDHNLINFLRTKDWMHFAKGYNGAGFKKNQYDEKLQEAYDHYQIRRKPSR